MTDTDRDVVLPRLAVDGIVLPDFLSVEQVLAHPRFIEARNCYMRVMLHSYADDPALKHLMHDIARNVLFNIILGRYALYRPEDPSTWPTVGMIRQWFLPFKIASARSLDQMLARMQVLDLIELVPAPGDRRRRLVLPTERMIENDLTWLALHMEPLAVLCPELDDYLPALQRDRAHQMAQRIISTQNYGTAFDLISPDDPIMAVLLRQDACQIVYRYMLEAQEQGDGRFVSLAFENVAEPISTSRTHVRNLIRELEALGVVIVHERGGHQVELMPALWERVDLFLAGCISGHDLVWQLARQLVAAEAIAA